MVDFKEDDVTRIDASIKDICQLMEKADLLKKNISDVCGFLKSEFHIPTKTSRKVAESMYKMNYETITEENDVYDTLMMLIKIKKESDS